MNQYIAVCIVLYAATALAQDRETRRDLRSTDAVLEVVEFEGRAVVAGELLVKFRDGDSQKLRGDGVRMRRYRVAAARDLGRSGYSHLQLTERGAMRDAIAELSLDPDVEYVEPNYIVEASATPNDPMFNRQWALKNTGQDGGLAKADIDATTAWETAKGSKKFVIGIVDTGVDYTHPDLAPNAWSAPRSFTVTFSATDKITCPAGSRGYNAVKNTCDPKDNATHGTMVAGTIGAAGNNSAGVSGVAWTASLMGLAFMDSTGKGSVANAIRAIEFAIQAKQTFGDAANIRILNNSWGGSGFSQALLDAINKAAAAGMLFVAAAGNTSKNLDATPEYPAAYTAASLITVAATDNKDALATFSSYGAKNAHVGAPGVSIATTSPGGGYSLASGTSFAAPLTSGVAALVLSVCETLDTAALRKTIIDSVNPVPGLAGKTSTGGRINAYKAVTSCKSTAAPAPAPSTTPTVRPGFTMAASPLSATLSPGQTASLAVRLTATGGFNSPVALTIAGLPAGVTAVFAPPSITPAQTATLTLTAAATAPVMTTTATASLRGVNGATTATASVAVSVREPPSFNITGTPSSATIRAGASAAYTLKVTPTGGFAQSIVVQLAGLPAGTTAQIVQPVSGTLSVTVKSTTAVVPKSYPLVATATGGTIKKTVPLTLVVTR